MKRIFRKRVKTEKINLPCDYGKPFLALCHNNISDCAKTEQVNSTCDEKCSLLNPESKYEDTKIVPEEKCSEKGKGHSGIFWKFRNKKRKSLKERPVSLPCATPYTVTRDTKETAIERKEQEIKHFQTKSTRTTSRKEKDKKDINKQSLNNNHACDGSTYASYKSKVKEGREKEARKNSQANFDTVSESTLDSSEGFAIQSDCVDHQSCNCTTNGTNKQTKSTEPLWNLRRERKIGDGNEQPLKREPILQSNNETMIGRKTSQADWTRRCYTKFKKRFDEMEGQRSPSDSSTKQPKNRESVYQEYRVFEPASKLSHRARLTNLKYENGRSECEYIRRSKKPARIDSDVSFYTNIFSKYDDNERERIKASNRKPASTEITENKCKGCIHRPWWLGGRNSSDSQSLKMDMVSFASWLNILPSERELSHFTNPNPERIVDGKSTYLDQATCNLRYEDKLNNAASENSMVEKKLEKTITTTTSVYNIDGDKLKAVTINETFREKFMRKLNQPDTLKTFEIAAMDYFFGLLDLLITDKKKTMDKKQNVVHKTNSSETQDGQWWMGRGKVPILSKKGNEKEEQRPSVEVSETHQAIRNTQCKMRKNTTTSIYNVIEDRLNRLNAENTNQTRNSRHELIEKFTQLAPKTNMTYSDDISGVKFPASTDMTENSRKLYKLKNFTTLQKGCGTDNSSRTSKFSEKNPSVTSPNRNYATYDNNNTRASVYNTMESKLETLTIENANQTSRFTDRLMNEFSRLITPKIVEINSDEYIIIVRDKKTTSIYNMVEDRLKTWASKNCNKLSSPVTDEVVDPFKELNIPRVIELGSREYIMAVGSKRKTFSKSGSSRGISKTPKCTVPKSNFSNETEHTEDVPLDVRKDEKQVATNLNIESARVPGNIEDSKPWQIYGTYSDLYELGEEVHNVITRTASDYNVKNQYFSTSNHNVSNANPASQMNQTVFSTHTQLTYVSSSAIELTSKRSENLFEVQWEPASYNKSTRTSINSDGSSKKQMYNKQRNIEESITPANKTENSIIHDFADHDEEITTSFGTELDGTQTSVDKNNCCDCDKDRNYINRTSSRSQNLWNNHTPNSLRGRAYTDKDSAYSTCSGSHKRKNKLLEPSKKAEEQCCYCKRREFSSRAPKLQKTTQKSIYFSENQREGHQIHRALDEESWYDVNNTATQYTPTNSQEFRDNVLSCIDYVIFLEPVDVGSLN